MRGLVSCEIFSKMVNPPTRVLMAVLQVQEQVSKSLIKRIILKLAIRSKMNDIRR